MIPVSANFLPINSGSVGNGKFDYCSRKFDYCSRKLMFSDDGLVYVGGVRQEGANSLINKLPSSYYGIKFQFERALHPLFAARKAKKRKGPLIVCLDR